MYKTFKKYKPSGVEWIHKIPKHWEVSKVKKIAKIFGRIGYRGYTVNDIEEEGKGAISLSPSNLIDNKFNLNQRTYISYDKYYESPEIMVYNGDVIFVKTASVGKAGLVAELKDKATINPQLVVFKNCQLDSRFLYYSVISDQFQFQTLRDTGGGVVGTITQSSLNNYFLFIPDDKTEQIQIADFLDKKTAQIDDLIAKKKRLIELLEEEKTAVINEAVTKGIDSHVKLKDSGIEWLGKIPEHWEVRRLKYNVKKVGSGVTPRGGSNVYQESGIPLLRSQNIHFDGIKLNDVAYISEKIHNSMLNSKVRQNDVLLNITGASLGRCSVFTPKTEANVNQHVCIIRPTNKIDPFFLFYIISSFIGQVQIKIDQTGSGREGLNFEVINNFIIPSTIIDEQNSIVEFIENETTQIDKTIKKTKELVELLKEYRTALISEAVTGKIKVVDDKDL